MNELAILMREIFTSFNADIQSLLTLQTLFVAIGSYLLVVWLACIVWVIKDITSRTNNILIQVAAILLVICFTPIFWLPIYLLIRPKSTLFEQFYEETSLSELTASTQNNCKSCNWLNLAGAKYCIHCGESLEELCKKCRTPLVEEAKFCGECGQSKIIQWPSIVTIKAPKKSVKKEG
jgi:RNA polymerase subunit RPABC4/transcription elongation factor Spt4